MPLMELIETCLFDIIHTEDTTGRFIRLYGAGDYWHAFEESAYQLSQLFVTHDVTVLRHKVYPFPVLMVSISYAVFCLKKQIQHAIEAVFVRAARIGGGGLVPR